MMALLKKLEVDKCALVNRSDFTIEAAFKLFADSPLEKLCHTDILARLNQLGVSCQTKDATLLLKRYDADCDSKLNFWEFTNIFMPLDETVKAKLDGRTSSGLSNATKSMVIGLLGRIIDVENSIEEIRQKIKGFGSSLRQIYDEFDWLNRGFLTDTELKRNFDCYPDETQ